MQTLKLIRNIFIVLLALGVTLFLLGFIKQYNSNKGEVKDDTEVLDYVTSLKGVNIYLDSVKSEDVVKSPLIIKGRAPGNWFFEASAPVIITNWDGLIIGESYITAQGEWMTTDYVPFEGELSFENTEYGDYGFLILQKSNASDLPEHDDSIEIKVFFK